MMGENAFGAQTLKVINELHQEGIQNYVALIRHSARHYDTAENDIIMGLTEEGKQTSFEFGKALPSNSSIRFFSSPVNRCVETSDFIEKGHLSRGGKTQTNIVIDGLSPFYVKDVPKVMQMAYEWVIAGNYPKFFRNWFDGEISAVLIEDASQSAQRLLNVLVELLQKPLAQGNICVSHDWNLFLLKEYYLGLKPEVTGNIEFLEGVIIYKWNDNYHITSHQSETRVLKVPQIKRLTID